MKTITTKDMNRKTGTIVQELQEGNIMLVTHYGKPIGKIVPIEHEKGKNKKGWDRIDNLLKDIEVDKDYEFGKEIY